MTSEEINNLKELVQAGEVRIITIDSSIFQPYGASLNTGLLGRLSQFKESRFQLVLSEIVMRETTRHITELLDTTLSSWSKITKKLGDIPQVIDEVVALNEALTNISPNSIAATKVDQFLIATGADVVSADHAQIRDVLNLYFERKPPFALAGKRNEFPDAIALLGIEAWCAAAQSGAIVVTNDNDWKCYCEASNARLFVLNDLATALEIINSSEAERNARAVARQQRLIEQLGSGQLLEEAKRQLKRQLLSQTQAKGSSHTAYVGDISRIEIGSVSLSDPSRIRDDDKEFAILVTLHTHCIFWANFEFYVSESNQKLGQGVYGFSRDIDALALLSAQDDTTSVEVLPSKETLVIDFGEIEPDPDGEISHLAVE
jgi:hypothetical protein